MITTFVIVSRRLRRGGHAFGSVGAYENLRGHACGELDPLHPLNAGIVDIERAPRNADGRVEYRVDIEIDKPVDMARGNGTLLYEVVNRGHRVARAMLDVDLAHGFTFAWSGWEIDDRSENRALQRSLYPNEQPIEAQLPVAVDGSEPVTGLSREEFTDIGTGSVTRQLFYPAHNTDPAACSLTVRQTQDAPRQLLPQTQWAFVDASRLRIDHPGAPFDAGAIFEFIYPARDPIVAAVGFAAMRDVNAFLRHATHDRAGNPNPLLCDGAPAIRRAILTGVSQSGRVVRDFLWQGFNEAETGQTLFEGALPIVAGARRSWTNFRFAQPGRVSRRHEEHLQPGDQFPFTYATTRDPITGEEDGILARCSARGDCPKILHVDSESEIWDARGSLLFTDGDPSGPAPVPLPDNVRLYIVAGTAHNGDAAGSILSSDPPLPIVQNRQNPQGAAVVARALLLSLDAWIRNGTPPPPSCYGTLDGPARFVEPAAETTGFPAIPGVMYTGQHNDLRVTDYAAMPPSEGAAYKVLMPRVDADGNSLAGIRLPAVAVPIGTYTGWNLRRSGHGAGDTCGFVGSFIPFCATAAERAACGDPRLSLEERYGTHAAYVARVREAADRLVEEGFLLQRDAEAIVAQASSDAVQRRFPL